MSSSFFAGIKLLFLTHLHLFRHLKPMVTGTTLDGFIHKLISHIKSLAAIGAFNSHL